MGQGPTEKKFNYKVYDTKVLGQCIEGTVLLGKNKNTGEEVAVKKVDIRDIRDKN